MKYFEQLSRHGNNFLLFSFIMVCCLFLSLSGSVPAKAASVFDNFVAPTDSLHLQRDSTFYLLNDTWYNEAVSICTGFEDDFDDMMNATVGAYAVTRADVTNTTTSAIRSSIIISLQIEGSIALTWQNSPPNLSVRNPITHAYEMSINSMGNAVCSETGGSQQVLASNEQVISGTQTVRYYPFISTYEPNYPAGYEGELLPAPVPANTLVPDIFMHSVVDFRGEFSDRNYLTTDGLLPVLCEPGALVPAITITLYEGASSMGEPIDTIQANASSVFWIDFKAYNPSYGEFTIVSEYTCGDGSTPVFSESSEYIFEVDENGFLVNQGFEACLTEVFPYVDFDACWNNMTLLVNSLSFSTISFAPDWRINDNECRTLGTIGDWLNAEGSNRVVCPQFSSEVRTIVTPFVTFILGVVTLGILMTKTRREVF